MFALRLVARERYGRRRSSFDLSLRGHEPGEAVEERLLDAVALGEGRLEAEDRPGLNTGRTTMPAIAAARSSRRNRFNMGRPSAPLALSPSPAAPVASRIHPRALATKSEPEIEPMKVGPGAQRDPGIPR